MRFWQKGRLCLQCQCTPPHPCAAFRCSSNSSLCIDMLHSHPAVLQPTLWLQRGAATQLCTKPPAESVAGDALPTTRRQESVCTEEALIGQEILHRVSPVAAVQRGLVVLASRRNSPHSPCVKHAARLPSSASTPPVVAGLLPMRYNAAQPPGSALASPVEAVHSPVAAVQREFAACVPRSGTAAQAQPIFMSSTATSSSALAHPAITLQQPSSNLCCRA